MISLITPAEFQKLFQRLLAYKRKLQLEKQKKELKKISKD